MAVFPLAWSGGRDAFLLSQDHFIPTSVLLDLITIHIKCLRAGPSCLEMRNSQTWRDHRRPFSMRDLSIKHFDTKGGPGTTPSRHQGTSPPSVISSRLSALDKRYSNFSERQKHWEDLFKPRPQRPAPRVSDWVNLMRHLKPACWTSFYVALENMREHTLWRLYNCFRFTQRNNSEAERGRAKDSPHSPGQSSGTALVTLHQSILYSQLLCEKETLTLFPR